MTQLTPQEEDPIVHGLLASLEQFSPSPGFADRVMSRVWQPAPTWVQRAARTCRNAFGRRRIWAVAGGLAATSAAATVAVTAAAIKYWVQVETVWSVLMNVGRDVWRFAVHATAGIAVLVMRWIESISISGSTLAVLAVFAGVVFALSGFGLQHTIRQYRNERMLLHAGK